MCPYLLTLVYRKRIYVSWLVDKTLMETNLY